MSLGLPFTEGKDFIRFSYKILIVLLLQIFNTQLYSYKKISASGLFRGCRMQDVKRILEDFCKILNRMVISI